MKTNRIIKVGIAVIAIAALSVGGSIAYYRAETKSDNEVTSVGLGIDIVEHVNGDIKTLTDKSFEVTSIMPGSEITRELAVENVKESPAYIRVTLTKYWEDLEGNKLFDKDAHQIVLTAENANDWIILDDDENGEVVYMFYKKPITTSELTSKFLKTVKIGKDGSLLNNEYVNLKAQVDVEVDAIQQYAATDAILAEWGLEVVINDDATLSEVLD